MAENRIKPWYFYSRIDRDIENRSIIQKCLFMICKKGGDENRLMNIQKYIE